MDHCNIPHLLATPSITSLLPPPIATKYRIMATHCYDKPLSRALCNATTFASRRTDTELATRSTAPCQCHRIPDQYKKDCSHIPGAPTGLHVFSCDPTFPTAAIPQPQLAATATRLYSMGTGYRPSPPCQITATIADTVT
jgi:hypothetical protein